MREAIDRYFLSHPRSVDESYLVHAGVALGISFRLFGAALAALVHAVIPCLFVTTASSAIKSLNLEMTARANRRSAGPGPDRTALAGEPGKPAAVSSARARGG